MAKDEIIDKLKKLADDKGFPLSECEVVYFMVETRKLLDREKIGNNFKTLYFYCNWVVHTSLDRGYAKKILDKIEAQIMSGQPIIQNQELYGIISFSELRKQIKIFNGQNDIKHYLDIDDNWGRFKALLLDILVDCPLENRPNEFKIRKFEYKISNNGQIEYLAEMIDGSHHPGILLDI